MVRKIVIPIIFTVGMLIFFYPIIGNWLSAKDHYSVINTHNEVLAQMSEEQKEAERLKAEEYNKALKQNTHIAIQDPFDLDKEALDENSERAVSYYNVLDVGEAMGTIEIPVININLPIYHGVSEKVLTQGIGHMSNSSFPVGGLGTHSALTGHRGLPTSKLFRDLDKVQIGDVFYIHSLGKTLAYKVDHIQIVLPTETNWLEIREDKDYVTLITCEPYMINSHRLLVRGERIPHEIHEMDEVVEASSIPSVVEKDPVRIIEFVLFMCGLIIILAILHQLSWRRWMKRKMR